MITGTAFVDLSAAYDTVNHRLLIQKLYNTTLDSQLCRVIQKLLSDRRFYVEMNNERIRWRIQKNGLPQGSVLSPTLFNTYTNDQPILDGTRSFIYADDLCVTAQYPTFQVWERSAYAHLLNPELNRACRAITGCLRPTNVENLYLLAVIAPPEIRRSVCARVERTKQVERETHSLFGHTPARRRLKSRRSFLTSVQPVHFPAKVVRVNEWKRRLEEKA